MTTKEFKLGPQPNWANVDPAPPRDGKALVEQLLKEDCKDSLEKRGYAVVRVGEQVRALYDEFFLGFREFCNATEEERLKFANLQFDQSTFSPNQFHGYSEVQDLKCQFMMRTTGGGWGNLPIPSQFGDAVNTLFLELDLLCRRAEEHVVANHPHAAKNLQTILDPLRSETYDLYPGYISSSILDCFLYFGAANNKDHRFFNNHAAHTDSGLLTLVVATDEPALEVLDQELEEWVAIDRAVHEFCSAPNEHRDYAILMWSDSVDYLRMPQHKSCLHRVQQTGGKQRISIVFKQRTSPLTTPPRYQEDYFIASTQLSALESAGIATASSKLAEAENNPDCSEFCSRPQKCLLLFATVSFILFSFK